MGDTKKCPYCGEEIKAVAKKCRFCGQWFDEESNEVKANEEVKPQNDASVEQVVPKGEEVKPQTESPIKQSAPKEEVKDDNPPPILLVNQIAEPIAKLVINQIRTPSIGSLE